MAMLASVLRTMLEVLTILVTVCRTIVEVLAMLANVFSSMLEVLVFSMCRCWPMSSGRCWKF